MPLILFVGVVFLPHFSKRWQKFWLGGRNGGRNFYKPATIKVLVFHGKGVLEAEVAEILPPFYRCAKKGVNYILAHI